MTISLPTKGLHTKRWEPCPAVPAAHSAGYHLVTTDGSRLFAVTASGGGYVYDGLEHGWLQLPTTSLGGSFSNGAASRWNPQGPSGTASAGTTSTITTSLTLARDLRGCKIRITAGPNAGAELTISSNTTGANSIITVPTQGDAFTGSTTFVIMSGRLWCVVGSTGFGYYDWALNTWTSRTTTGLTAGSSVTGNLFGTNSTDTGVLSTGTATAGGGTTLTDSGKAWTSNALSNLQVRITSGTGAGQIRTIASNTSTQITVSAAWTVNPDATSVYVVEGNDDYFYFTGNSAVAMYRYSIAGNAWSTLSPGVARAAAPGNGACGWIPTGVTDSAWIDAAAPLNGRYIYTFRGNSGAILDRYDIAANSWSAITYAVAQETLTAGACAVGYKDRLYVSLTPSSGAAQRFAHLDVVKSQFAGLSTLAYPAGSPQDGHRLGILTYTNGNTVPFLHVWRPSGAEMFRQMLF